MQRYWTNPMKREEISTAYLFLLPFLALWLVWFLLPLVQSFGMSFQNYSFIKLEENRFTGLENYARLFQDEYFWKAVRHTLVFVLVTVPAILVISLPIANLLNGKMRGRSFFRTVYYLPDVISPIAVTTVFMYLFVKKGAVSRFMTLFGFPNTSWFTDITLALPFVMAIYVWQMLGFYIVVYLSGLQSIPAQVYESARIDGANGRQIFFRITVPMMRPTLVFGLTYSVINAFQVFDQIAAVSQNRTLGTPAGATSTMVTFFYSNAFQYFDMGYGSAAAVALFALILLVSVLQKRLIDSDDRDPV